jgi:hypothetical protein
LGFAYTWIPCCFKWRAVKPQFETSKKPDNPKLAYIYDALDYMQISGDRECATQVMDMILKVKDYEDIFKFEYKIIRYIKAAIVFYNQEIGLEVPNFCQEICADLKAEKARKRDHFRVMMKDRDTKLSEYIASRRKIDMETIDLLLHLMSSKVKPLEPKKAHYDELFTKLWRDEDMTEIRATAVKLFPEYVDYNDASLLKRIAARMCHDEHVDFEREFHIFIQCRMYLGEHFDDDLDLDLLCYWGQRIKANSDGEYYFVDR